MKRFDLKWKLLLFSICPIFMQNVCGKHDLNNEHWADFPSTDEYITWRMPGYFNRNIVSPDVISYSFDAVNKNIVEGNSQFSSPTNVYLSFDASNGVGTYSVINFSFYSANHYFIRAGTPLTVTITALGSPGQYIVGSYTGTVIDSLSGQSRQIFGNFKVKNQ